MLRRTILPVLFLAACASLQADVTMRMSMVMKINMAVPAAVPQLPFNEVLTRIKGDHGISTMGSFTTVTDISRDEITLIDNDGQRYAIIPMADYLAKSQAAGGASMQNLPDQAKQMLANVKIDVASHDTGRTDRIAGIDAFEHEVDVNMSIPVPIPGQENGLQMNFRFHTWKPKPGETERVPALRELAAYNDRNQGFNNPMNMMRQMFSAMPGMSEGAGKIADEMKKGGSVIIGMEMGIFMPGLAKMMEQVRAGGAKVPDIPSGDTPLAEMHMDLKELSTDPVAAGVFTIPAGYKEASADDLMKGLLAAFTGGKPSQAPPSPVDSPKK